jgi:sugar lactone lactonase YvrE
MSDLTVLLDGLVMGESPRWHDGRLWFCDWGAQEIIALDASGRSEVIVKVDSFPFCIDWLPDGRLLVVSAREGKLLTLVDGSLVTYADLGRPGWNDIAVDTRGNVFVNDVGFDFPGGEFKLGTVSVVTPAGEVRQVAEGVAFPNGMAVTADDSTLIVAESYGHKLTAFDIAADGSLSRQRVWAQLDETAAPDGICLDAENAVWYADVPNQHCVRVAEGGEILDTVSLDRGAFACALGGNTLYVTAAKWPDVMQPGSPRTGQVVTAQVSVPGIKGADGR